MVEGFFLNAILYAQTYPFKHYSTADGLPQATVGKMFQDSRGYLWFGTHGGICRYDGVEFTQFLSIGETRSVINDIWEDEEQALWIATHGNGIAKLSLTNGDITWLKSKDGILPSDYVHSLYYDSKKNLWIGTRNGILIFNADSTTSICDTQSGFPYNNIRRIAEDSDGNMWIGANDGLLRTQWANKKLSNFTTIFQQPVRSMIRLRDGSIVAGTFHPNGGVYHITSQKIERLLSPDNSGRGLKVEALLEDEQGRIWAGTSTGIYIITPNGTTLINTNNGLENALVGEILQDKEGTIWIGTANGVVKLTSPQIISYGIKDGLSGSSIISLFEDHRGNLWLGSYDGATRLGTNGRLTRYGVKDGLLERNVYAFGEENDNNLWIGSSGGVNVLAGGTIKNPPFPILRKQGYVSMATDSDGDLLIGLTGTIIKLHNNSIVWKLDTRHGIPSSSLTTLLRDRQGRLWFGTSRSGCGYYSEQEARLFNKQHGLPDLWIERILEDRNGKLWFTTHRGIARWNGERFERFYTFEPAVDDGVVYDAIEDSSDHLWFCTQFGVYEWRDSILQHITSQDGLAGDVVRKGLVGRDGTIWFATHNGVTRFEANNYQINRASPKTQIDQIAVGIDAHQAKQQAELSYDERTVLFKFNALSFINEKYIQFQCKLEGFDHNWLPPQKQRQVRYTNLAPGSYTFVVRSANRNGPWSDPVRHAFIINPPYWQTWWFIALVVISISAVTYLVYRYRLNQLLKIERMRTRIATDLHDDIGASLSRIALFSEVAREEATKASPRLLEMSQKIGDNARELLDAVGTLVWSIDPRHDRFEDVVTHMKNFAQEMFSAKGIDYTLEVQPDVMKLRLPLDVRKNLLLIFKEAVNNVIRHAECQKSQVKMLLANGMFEMIIADDGKGLPAHGTHDGHGLTNMKLRARAMKAELSINSPDGKGTVVSLRLSLA